MKFFLGVYFLFLGLSFHQNSYAQDSVLVNNIRIEGNKRTEASILIRELTFKIGQNLPTLELEKIFNRSTQNITNTNLFFTVTITQKIDSMNNLDVLIKVKERWYFIALPIALLADRSFNEWWYDRDRDLKRITYGINAKHYNLTGNNDKLIIKAYAGFIPYIELSYAKPYIDKRKRIGIRFGTFYSSQRTLPYRTWNDKLDFYDTEKRMRERKSVFFELRLRNALYYSHIIYTGFTNTIISDSIATLNPNYFGKNTKKQNVFTFNYDYKFDKRDNRNYALKGNLFNVQFSTFFITSGKQSIQSSVLASFNKYYSLGHKFYFETTLKAKVSAPKKQFYPLLQGFGFSNNFVRGFELYVIDGQHTILSKNSLKYQLINRRFNFYKIVPINQLKDVSIAVYPNLFYDLGGVKNYFPEFSNSKLSNKLLKGGGAGFDIVTGYNVNLKMYYSINQMSESGFYISLLRDL